MDGLDFDKLGVEQSGPAMFVRAMCGAAMFVWGLRRGGKWLTGVPA
jgi:hypothetical protein